MSKTLVKSSFSIVLVLVASACTTVETLRPDVEARLPPSRLEEIAYINALRDALHPNDDAGCYRGDENYFRSDLGQGYREHTAEQEQLSGDDKNKCVKFKDIDPASNKEAIRKYLDAGYGLSSLYCQRFFVVANQSKLKRDFQRNGANSLDTLIGSILTLTSAGDTAVGIVNGGFGLIDSTYQNFNETFLVAADLGRVQNLVAIAQNQHAQKTYADPPENYLAARRNIEAYAQYCTYTGMESLVSQSLDKLATGAKDRDENITNLLKK